jgi:CRP-like cAMP-binding protein
MTTIPDIKCATCEFRASGLFCRLEERLFEKLDREKTVRVFRAGEILFYQDSPSLAIYCIHGGIVKLFKMGDKGEAQVIRLLGPGESPGYRPVSAGEPYAATAEALEKSTVCIIPRQCFLELIDQSKDLALEVMARLARDLRISEEQMLSLTQLSVKKRVAGLLLQLCERAQGLRQTAAVIPCITLKRKEMAQMIGTTPETLSRTLKELAQRDVVAVTRREIQLKDKALLQRIAQ